MEQKIRFYHWHKHLSNYRSNLPKTTVCNHAFVAVLPWFCLCDQKISVHNNSYIKFFTNHLHKVLYKPPTYQFSVLILTRKISQVVSGQEVNQRICSLKPLSSVPTFWIFFPIFLSQAHILLAWGLPPHICHTVTVTQGQVVSHTIAWDMYIFFFFFFFFFFFLILTSIYRIILTVINIL